MIEMKDFQDFKIPKYHPTIESKFIRGNEKKKHIPRNVYTVQITRLSKRNHKITSTSTTRKVVISKLRCRNVKHAEIKSLYLKLQGIFI